MLCGDWSSGGVNMDMYLKHLDRPRLYINGCSGSPLSYSSAYQPTSTWVKLSAVRTGSTLKFLVNDVEQASTTCTGTISARQVLPWQLLGGNTAQTPPGYLDEFKHQGHRPDDHLLTDAVSRNLSSIERAPTPHHCLRFIWSSSAIW